MQRHAASRHGTRDRNLASEQVILRFEIIYIRSSQQSVQFSNNALIVDIKESNEISLRIGVKKHRLPRQTRFIGFLLKIYISLLPWLLTSYRAPQQS